MSVRHRIAIGILLLACTSASASTQVRQPARAFGYVIGDMLEQRVWLQAEGQPVELTELPVLQREGPWLQRRASSLFKDSQNRSWLVLRYQVINAPTDPIVIALPAVNLNLTNGAELTIEAWPFSISPLTPVSAKEGQLLAPIRPDRAPLAPDTHPADRRLKLFALLLAITLLSWFGWWFWRRHVDVQRLPFARAFHDLRKLDSELLDENPDAWLILHRAFNGAAGRTIHRSAVVELVRQQPWLESLQASVEAFYLASAARFFAESEQPQAFALADFSRRLYLAEKRQANPGSQARL